MVDSADAAERAGRFGRLHRFLDAGDRGHLRHTLQRPAQALPHCHELQRTGREDSLHSRQPERADDVRPAAVRRRFERAARDGAQRARVLGRARRRVHRRRLLLRQVSDTSSTANTHRSLIAAALLAALGLGLDCHRAAGLARQRHFLPLPVIFTCRARQASERNAKTELRSTGKQGRIRVAVFAEPLLVFRHLGDAVARSMYSNVTLFTVDNLIVILRSTRKSAHKHGESIGLTAQSPSKHTQHTV